MQILLGLIAGAVIGLAVHFTLGDRDVRGAALLPMIGAAAAGIAWTAATWAGAGIDSPWPWAGSLVVPIAVTLPIALTITRRRRDSDARTRHELRIGSA
ncbi:hypothetical protein ABXJ56_12230 [Microbacterium chocolatum]|uniref:hypothetical protein n=1 Tax=Microbacterium aurantiacum TaxID=162393 RepID=UPI00338E2528